MKTRSILSTALVGLTLYGAPCPSEAKRRPAPGLSDQQICAGFAQFAYTRALERDGGMRYSVALEQTMTWDTAQGVALAVRQYHQGILAALYAHPQVPPLGIQSGVETVCLRQMTGTPASTR